MTSAANLTANQIAYFASQQGFSGANLGIAVAVALAESGGNPSSHNSTPPDDSYGLWQINMIGTLGPARRKTFNITSNDRLFDPNVNAKAAHIIYTGSGWKAWTTYTSGKYKQFLTVANAAKPDNSAGRTPDQETAYLATVRDDATPDALIPNSITSSLNAFGATLFRSVSNLTGVIIAIALVIAGIVVLVMQTKSGSSALKSVTKVL